MKYTQILALISAITLGWSSAANAKDTSRLVDVSNFNGMKVTNTAGKNIGEIQQVLVDPQSGTIRYGVLEVDKDWSLADPEVAVPWGAFDVTGKGENLKLSLDATKEKLENAPRTKVGEADKLFTPKQSKPIYDYWSIYWWDVPTSADTTSNASDSTQKTGKDNDSSNATQGKGADNAANTQNNESTSSGTKVNATNSTINTDSSTSPTTDGKGADSAATTKN